MGRRVTYGYSSAGKVGRDLGVAVVLSPKNGGGAAQCGNVVLNMRRFRFGVTKPAGQQRSLLPPVLRAITLQGNVKFSFWASSG